MITHQSQSEIKVDYLGEAVILQLFGFTFLRVEPTAKPRKRVFVFDPSPPAQLGMEYSDAAQVIWKFNRDQLTWPDGQPVPWRKFFNLIHDMKAELYSTFDGGEYNYPKGP